MLAAATELFIAHGNSFTTADLAQAAGVSEGTIFRYFPDKPSLLAAAREGALGLESLIPELVAAAELPTIERRLIAAGTVLSDRIAQMARIMEDVEHSHTHGPPDADLVAELLSALVPLFEGVSLDAPGSAGQLANVFLGMLVSNTLFCAKSGTPPMDIASVVELFVRGIAAGGVGSGPPVVE